jgi:phage protein D
MTESDAIPIYTGQDFYVPYFEVKMRGGSLDEEVVRDITQVTYKDNIKEIDNFEITINNWDAEKLDFKYSDQNLFDPGKELELWMGYYGGDRLRLMITGEITSLRPTFPASGPPTLAISGLNLLHRFRTEKASHVYEEMTDSEIAEQIGNRLGVTMETNPPPEGEDRHPYLLQDNQFDIIFLMERAQRVGYDLFVKESGENGQANESVLYFGPSINVQEVTYQLTYRRSLIEFQPDLTTANQVAKVTVRGWDAESKEKIEETVTRADIATQGVGEEGGQAAIENSFADREEVITDQPVQTPEEARTLARETLESIAKDMVKGSGSTVGLPDLRAGNVVEIDGLGERFSGRYFVTATTHSIGDGGYTTQFDCRREEVEGG